MWHNEKLCVVFKTTLVRQKVFFMSKFDRTSGVAGALVGYPGVLKALVVGRVSTPGMLEKNEESILNFSHFNIFF